MVIIVVMVMLVVMMMILMTVSMVLVMGGFFLTIYGNLEMSPNNPLFYRRRCADLYAGNA